MVSCVAATMTLAMHPLLVWKYAHIDTFWKQSVDSFKSPFRSNLKVFMLFTVFPLFHFGYRSKNPHLRLS